MDQSKTTTIVVVIVLIVLGVFGWMMWMGSESEEPNLFSAEEQVNPFEESANPYANIKTNPFE